MTAERTPGPWRVSGPYRYADDDFDHFSISSDATTGHWIGLVQVPSATPAVGRANAEFLCRAANVHDALVEAAELALPIIIAETDGFNGYAINKLRTAIAAATEPGS